MHERDDARHELGNLLSIALANVEAGRLTDARDHLEEFATKDFVLPMDTMWLSGMVAYAEGRLGPVRLPLSLCDRVVAIGSDRMMAAVARARHGVLARHLKQRHVAIGSINSPMQCMMKEICAQCLQPHVDPKTGVTRYVFSCYNQDQPLDLVDFAGLRQCLGQNGVQEKLTARWIDHVLAEEGARTR